jgi:tetratricopeptide (TPR) repeat protein
LAITVFMAGAFGASPAAAQYPSGKTALPGTDAWLQHAADSLYRAGRHQESLAVLEKYLEGSPRDYRVEALAAREALVLGLIATEGDSAKAWFYRAIAHGERAMAIEPLGEDGRYFTLAAEGRLGLLEGPRERARLGVVVDSAARNLLAQDSLHAGAHNALGRLYVEVAGLSWIERLVARRWVGGDLVSRSTWKAAEEHLRRAVELQPERNLYYVDLGALLVKRDRPEEARSVLEAALQVPLEFPGEEIFRDDARRLLDRIERRAR